ncbi:hypothetical protein [Burkholderia contaminans]|uniref:Uncharacterized protein n=2 Tax=Burkholderia contaminans TaxID=488447 RepID=A0ABD7XWQ2_9BURK|nr:hypothetical protein [Burkholderia contaminans]KKL43992.1 hypothetical protein WR31_01990 [Burkholderia contaminans LMG 23361]MBH9690950.1 hypothetical protein [Burkholderia contaminans]MBY4823377.1 hypothetical protein [Burkholderia contaminans]MBY4854085.1 hypothetical protein [Burkholderia contaminans]MBY4879982.1 hypothetical protein [Burkholderia contaminans]
MPRSSAGNDWFLALERLDKLAATEFFYLTSPMAKTCIFGGGPAGSGEHTFPAAFGGRRTNKGIYCTKHNNEFGRHVAALLESMDIINAKLGVIPDRHDEVRPAPAAAQDGERFLVSKSSTHIAPPLNLDKTPELVGRGSQQRFANMEQAQQWAAQQERAGYKVTLGKPSEVKTQFVARPLSAVRMFGGESFMRGVVYLAVTFLAHAFPELARSQSLAAARDLIENDGPVGDRVWWEPPEVAAQRSKNPFDIGHSVVIAPDKEGRRVVALISFYDALHLGVDLGELTGTDSLAERFTTHIDPMARRPPNDIVESWEPGLFLSLSTREVAKKYIRLLATGQVPNPLGPILKAADETERKDAAMALLPQLLAVPSLTGYERDRRLDEILATQQQRVLNLMVEFVTGLQQEKSFPEPVHTIFGAFIAVDENAPRGISFLSEAALGYATHSLRARIEEHLASGTLDVPALAELLGGAEGFRIVAGALNELFQQTLPRELS